VNTDKYATGTKASFKQAAADNETDLLKASNVLKPTPKAKLRRGLQILKTHTISFPVVVLVSDFKTRR
jgi:hypothetical protein